MTQVRYQRKNEWIPSIILIIAIFVLAGAVVTTISPGVFVWREQPSIQQAATSVNDLITKSLEYATATPKTATKPLTFSQLVKTWNTPEDAQKFMIEHFQKYQKWGSSYGESHTGIYSPDELLAGKDDANVGDFAHFFRAFLIKKWGDQYKVRTEHLMFRNSYRMPEDKNYVVVVYTDPADGTNYYMVPEPAESPMPIKEGFTIYNMGKSTFARSFEIKRLGSTIAPKTCLVQTFSLNGPGATGYLAGTPLPLKNPLKKECG